MKMCHSSFPFNGGYVRILIKYVVVCFYAFVKPSGNMIAYTLPAIVDLPTSY